LTAVRFAATTLIRNAVAVIAATAIKLAAALLTVATLPVAKNVKMAVAFQNATLMNVKPAWMENVRFAGTTLISNAAMALAVINPAVIVPAAKNAKKAEAVNLVFARLLHIQN
jgi:hypothetical protein